MLIPSIDLLDGKAVQLEQGDVLRKIIEKDNVFELLDEYSLFGEVAIIDLNAALGNGDNKALIKEMIKRQPCRVGGGIRNYDIAREYLSAGAKKIIIGTSCRSSFVKKLPKSQLIFAIDAKDDQWVTNGWKSKSSNTILDIIPELQKYCHEFLYTQVSKEGLMQGIDRLRIKAVIENSDIPVTIAGGITTIEDVQYINQLGANCQIGMSLYTGLLKLEDAILANLDFEESVLIPTVVQDAKTNKILMLAYSSIESLKQAVRNRSGTFFSRSRNEIWEKGLTSGNTQELVNIDYDCDGDSLIFKVNQVNNACHYNRYSCFSSQYKEFNLDLLDETLQQRLDHPSTESYSSTLLASSELQSEKIREECEELIEAVSPEHVRWEAADLLFFALINAKSKGVSIKEIIAELGARNA